LEIFNGVEIWGSEVHVPLSPILRPQEKGLNVALFPVLNSFDVCRRLTAIISLSKNCHTTCSVSVMSLRIPTCLPGLITNCLAITAGLQFTKHLF